MKLNFNFLGQFVKVILIALNSFTVLSQQKIPFHRISTSQGLSQSTIYCSFQDSHGFLWFGTSEGLNRYDGYGFKVFRHILNDKNSLNSNDIFSIGEDASGNIWVGTRTRGLSILNIETLKFDNKINISGSYNLSNVGISTIIKDKNSDIWFSTGGLGLFKQDHRTKKIIKINTGEIDSKNISTAYLDKKGFLWFGTNKLQLHKFENDRIINTYHLGKQYQIPNIYLSGISEAASGKMYFTTSHFGLFSLDENEKIVKNIVFNPKIIDAENNMKGIVCDKENTLYISTNNGLLIIPNENTDQLIHQIANSSKRFELSTHALQSIMLDKNQNIWVGTWEGGINVFYRKQPTFSLLRHEAGVINGPLERKITSVAANNTSIWLGTNIGLSEYNRKTQTWLHFNQNKLSGNDINSLRYDAEGDLFISAYQRPLTLYFSKTKQFKNYIIPEMKSGGSINTFAPEKSGQMWIGTKNNGIYLFDKKTGEFDPIHKKFPALNWNISISSVLHDNQNRLWIGTTTDGIYVLNLAHGTFKKYLNGAEGHNLSDEHILALFQDKKGRIWVGTNGGGLNRFDDKTQKFSAVSEQDGLPNNTIKAILEDDKGNLWLSTNQGICNYNFEKNSFQNYTEQDGLQGKEFGRGVRSFNTNGELFFGGSNGLTYFHPHNLLNKPSQAPKIIFSDLKLFNKSIDKIGEKSPLKKNISLTNQLELKYNQSVFTVEYLALDFQQLKNYQYAYKLEGFDNDWNYVGYQRSASYTNMPDGNYTLKVKSTNNEGLWTENTASLKIKILPPWYRTIWAYLLYILALLTSLYIWRRVIRIRERLKADIRIQRIEAQKIKEIEVAKSNFFTNISHEFRTPLTLIISPIQQLLQNSNENKQSTLSQTHQIILKNAQRLLRLINQILDISKIESGNMKLEVSKSDLVEFLNSIAISFKTLAEKNNINYTINFQHQHRYCFFDKDIIEKITYNLLSNAFKFTPNGGSIDLSLTIKNQILTLAVADNGIGMDAETTSHIFERYYQAGNKKEPKSIGTGIGLALTKELVELHLGTIEVQSSLAAGSKFVVTLPISAEKFDTLQIKEHFNFQPEFDDPIYKPTKLPNAEFSLENDAPLILIVDDNQELREYLVGIFENKFKIEEAENGKIGYQKALETMPDIILSDYIMPIMDGAEFCKAVKTDEKTSHIPFLMLTSKKNNETIQASYEIGADDYILKPFNASLLVKKIENIIKARQILKEKFGKLIQEIPENVFHNETDEKFFKKAIGIIETYIDDASFDVTELENQLNMSKMQLYRKLKGVSNLAPNEFIRNIRLKRAAAIMQNTSMNVSEIAYAVGFNDPAYFARCFRKEFGKAPTDFMNRKVN